MNLKISSSFHAAAAILAIWGFWDVWWLRPPALIVYLGMLLPTPLMGGHYIVDVFAGIGVAVLAIAATGRLRLARGTASTSPALRSAQPERTIEQDGALVATPKVRGSLLRPRRVVGPALVCPGVSDKG